MSHGCKNLYKTSLLHDRALLLRKARQFFHDQAIIEVDCPLLSSFASIDAQIDLIPASYGGKERRFLHSSPEFGMKRLLAEGMGDIFQLSHVFRDGEYGRRHNPEFMMAEWYRIGFTLRQMMEDTVRFIHLFLGDLPFRILSYREAFKQMSGFDYVHTSEEDLLQYMLQQNIPIYNGIEKEGKDALLNLILTCKIEPLLGQQELTILAYYPGSQSALAQKQWFGDEQVAERFEIYFQGVELANGYHELTDASEQRRRFNESNAEREGLGKEKLPIDENFLQALEKGLPDCCGVAVGFDRLMMLRHAQNDIANVVSFSWNLA